MDATGPDPDVEYLLTMESSSCSNAVQNLLSPRRTAVGGGCNRLFLPDVAALLLSRSPTETSISSPLSVTNILANTSLDDGSRVTHLLMTPTSFPMTDRISSVSDFWTNSHSDMVKGTGAGAVTNKNPVK